jgi:ParB-like chromosome segregation protein Spo0J
VEDLTLETRRVTKLRPHPANSRVHSKEQIAALWASMKANGDNAPITIDETDTILAGHGRWAAKKLGKVVDTQVLVRRGLTDEQKRAYIIADNRIGEMSEWDKDKLMSEIEALAGSGLDLEYLNLGDLDSDLAEIAGSKPAGETPEDRADRKKPSRKKSGGDPHADLEEVEQQGGDPSKDKNAINFPLYAVLTPQQHKEWKALRGQLSDKQFIALLLDKREAVAQVLNGG